LLRTPKSRRSIGATCCRLIHRGNRSVGAIEGRSEHRAAQRSRFHEWLHAASRLHRIYLGNAMPTKSRGPPLAPFRTPRRSTVDVMSVKGALTTASARSRDDQRTDADVLQVLLGQAPQDPFFISFRRTAARQRRRRQIPAAQNITSRFTHRFGRERYVMRPFALDVTTRRNPCGRPLRILTRDHGWLDTSDDEVCLSLAYRG
jgi:hypothetical protein